jgi:hypothetical protein
LGINEGEFIWNPWAVGPERKHSMFMELIEGWEKGAVKKMRRKSGELVKDLRAVSLFEEPLK